MWGYRRSCGAQVQGKRSASFVMTVACAADVRFVVVDPNLGVTLNPGSMPFGQKKRPHGTAAAKWAAAAQRKAGGSPDGKLRRLIERFEGREEDRPNETKVCTFCGATQSG